MNDCKIVIELEPWEAEKMNIGLKFLTERYLANSGNMHSIPDESLKAISWLIAFRHFYFDDKPVNREHEIPLDRNIDCL